MKNEFALAFNEVIEEKQLPKDIILKAIESAMVSAYRKAKNASTAQEIQAKIDPETGKVSILAEKEIVETVEDDRTEVTLEEAHRYDPQVELGMMVMVDSTPEDFGRVAAQTARQVIQQRIRDAERQLQLDHYQAQVGEIISGIVQAVNAQGLTIGLEMRAEGVLSRKDMIPGERFRIHDRLRALVAEAKDSTRGPQIILSRTHRDFLRRLLENEVPEIYHGIVEIRSIAREPGERAKVAVSATQSGIDPVGACVGIRGVRIQAIVRELHDEKIDVIEWSDDPTVFIAKAISPARVAGVYLNETSGNNKTATVVVSEDQLSLAIGRDGQNARLAAKLTNWRIDIKSLTEAVSDSLNKVRLDPELAASFETGKETLQSIESLLAKKSEGRTLTPEEYETMIRFVDRVERQTKEEIQPAEELVEEPLMQTLHAAIPERYFQQNILDSGLPEHVNYILQEAGYATVGDLVLQMKFRSDDILRLQGIGPRAMTEIDHLMESIAAETAAATVLPSEEKPAAPSEGEAEIPVPTEMAAAAVIEAESELPQPEEQVATIEEVTQAPVEALETSAVTSASETETAVEEAPSSEEVETTTGKVEPTFEELMAMQKETIISEVEDIEEEDTGLEKGKKGKKKKHQNVEVEYDPDRDVVTVRKKHKRDGTDWDWDG